MRRICALLTMATLLPTAAQGQEKRLILIAGRPSHGPGDHEFRAGCLLLQRCLAGVKGLRVTVETNGWVSDPKAFSGASAVALYSDGGGGHPFIQQDRKKLIGELARKGVGIAALHYAVEVPKDNGGPEFLEWIGGYYEHMFSCNPMWAPKFRTFPKHPITRGVKPFQVRDEWYMHMRFRPDMKGITPILVDKPPDEVRKGPYVYPAGPYPHIVAASGQDEIMMWCVERHDGGRGFGWTGGHFHRNWGDDNYRKVVLNALVWLCRMEVPANGVESTVSAEDLKQNLDKK